MIRSLRRPGRNVATVGLTATLVIGGLLATGGTAALAAMDKRAGGHAISSPLSSRQAQGATRWSATSPTTHLGDRYQIAITNGPSAQRVIVRVQIMDHQNHQNTVAIQEILQLAPGEQRTLAATNSYGTANHFQTGLGSENDDLTFQVTLTDSSGQQTAWFNQSAFFKRSGQLRPLGGRGQDRAVPAATPGHAHG